MTVRSGFSLIECMGYCVVIGCVLVTLFSGLIPLMGTTIKIHKSMQQLSCVYTAIDFCVRDLTEHKPIDRFHGDGPRSLLWQYTFSGQYIEWVLSDDVLMRIEGKYDHIRNRWNEHSKSVVCKYLKDASFLVEDTGNVRKIRIQLVSSFADIVERIVWL